MGGGVTGGLLHSVLIRSTKWFWWRMGRERIGNVRLSIKGERRLFELLHGDCASLLLHHSSSYRVEMENSSDLSAGSIASFYNDDFEQNESRKSIFPWSKDLGNLSKKEKKVSWNTAAWEGPFEDRYYAAPFDLKQKKRRNRNKLFSLQFKQNSSKFLQTPMNEIENSLIIFVFSKTKRLSLQHLKMQSFLDPFISLKYVTIRFHEKVNKQTKNS